MKLGFYRAFEDKHRGSRELIKSRLRAYLPFLTALKKIDGDCKALDVGCGRGEWLELLKEIGINAHGVDLDDGMLAACRAMGLSAENGDAITYIKSIPSESLAVVSGFHFAEHIPFTDLQVFVQEALRVLKPAGLLVLETPNPENIVVGTSSFYLDPTHQHPIPPQLLSFLSEYYGFYRTKILRLQEIPELRSDSAPSLFNVLGGVSPDYSIVAQKGGNKDILSAFQDAFDTEYGLTLDELAARYDVMKKTKLEQIFSEKENLQAELNGVRAELGGVHAELGGVRAELGGVHAELGGVRAELGGVIIERTHLQTEFNNLLSRYQNELNEITRLNVELDKASTEQVKAIKTYENLSAENQKILQNMKKLDTELSRVLIELKSVYASTSWKITRPIRSIKSILAAIFYFPRRVIKRVLMRIVRFVRTHPGIKGSLVRLFSYFPMIDKLVLRLSRRVMNESALPLMAVINTSTSSQEPSLLESEKHFFDLFQHELSRRQGNKGKGDSK